MIKIKQLFSFFSFVFLFFFISLAAPSPADAAYSCGTPCQGSTTWCNVSCDTPGRTCWDDPACPSPTDCKPSYRCNTAVDTQGECDGHNNTSDFCGTTPNCGNPICPVGYSPISAGHTFCNGGNRNRNSDGSCPEGFDCGGNCYSVCPACCQSPMPCQYEEADSNCPNSGIRVWTGTGADGYNAPGCTYSATCSTSSCLACVSTVGDNCNRNACGGTGVVECDGTCSAAAPTVPPNHDDPCNRNSCGDGTGKINCDGVCSTSTTAGERSGWGDNCNRNSCGDGTGVKNVCSSDGTAGCSTSTTAGERSGWGDNCNRNSCGDGTGVKNVCSSDGSAGCSTSTTPDERTDWNAACNRNSCGDGTGVKNVCNGSGGLDCSTTQQAERTGWNTHCNRNSCDDGEGLLTVCNSNNTLSCTTSSAPAEREGYGDACNRNSCNDGTGTIQCDGSCSATTPAERTNGWNTACNRNSCGDGTGLYLCDGTTCSQPRPYCILGNAWDDNTVPPNCTKDSGDPNRVGDTVSLTGDATGTTTTDTSGNYAFHNLSAGNYTITYTVPAGFANNGTNPATRTLANNVDAVANFCITGLHSVSGTMFADRDNSGTINAGDTPFLTQITATLTPNATSNPNGSTGTANSSTTNGTFSFASVKNGAYSLSAPIPTSYKSIVAPAAFTVDNANVASRDFLVRGYTVTAHVYEDRSVPLNGVEDAIDTDYSGATVELLNSSGTTVLASGTTNASGDFVFVYLTTGTYQVRLTRPAGYQVTTTNPASTTITTTDRIVNFAVAREYTVSGRMYNDTDGSLTINAPDTGFADGVQTITLSNGLTGNTLATPPASAGTYTITNVVNGTYTITAPNVSGYKTTLFNPQTITVSNGNVISINFLVPGYSLTAHVYTDFGRNGAEDSSPCNSDPNFPIYPCDTPLGSVTVALSGGYTARPSGTTNIQGDYVFRDLKGGPILYTVTITVPAGTIATTANPASRALGPDGQLNFGVTPVYAIAGNVFVDRDKNQIKNGSELNYLASSGITISIATSNPTLNPNPAAPYNTLTYPGGSTFVINNVPLSPSNASWTVTHTTATPGYTATWPSGIPPSYSTNVGTYCRFSPSTTTDLRPVNATCGSGNIFNLNYGITNSYPWGQCRGGDCRIDSGFSVQIPAAPQTGAYAAVPITTGTPGIIYSGNGTRNFGQGSASQIGWIAGGFGANNYEEVFKPATPGVIRTSYGSYVAIARQSGINILDAAYDITNECGGDRNNCQLPITAANFPNGIYYSSTDLTLAATDYQFPNNNTYLILVNGDLRIRGQIKVPVLASAVFSVRGSIYIEPQVGALVNSPQTACVPAGTENGISAGCHIEGLYSADRSFVVEGTPNICLTSQDRRINIAGSVVVNASLAGTGAFQSNRDLCASNLDYPPYTLTERPDLHLNAPSFIRRTNYIWQEIAP